MHMKKLQWIHGILFFNTLYFDAIISSFFVLTIVFTGFKDTWLHKRIYPVVLSISRVPQFYFLIFISLQATKIKDWSKFNSSNARRVLIATASIFGKLFNCMYGITRSIPTPLPIINILQCIKYYPWFSLCKYTWGSKISTLNAGVK